MAAVARGDDWSFGGEEPSAPAGEPSLPIDAADSGIEHVIVVTMENRSFDHLLGWLRGADGVQAGLSFADPRGVERSTFALAPDYEGRAYADPDHSYEGGRHQYANGECDGWLRATSEDLFPIGFYRQRDLSFYGRAAIAWTVCDRYFCSFLGPTDPNRLFLHAAATDRLENTGELSRLPTIWDRLEERGLAGRYYFGNSPFLALWGERYRSICGGHSSFFADAAAGDLPHVAFVDPRFTEPGESSANDDHPSTDVRRGQAFLAEVYAAVRASPSWPRSVLVITYDEWGGFFDHVAPPLAPLTAQDPVIGNDGRLGFRVPCLVISPFARRGFVSHTQFDHTSILKMIEWRWGLDPLSSRDVAANNLALLLDFTKARRRAG